MNYHKYRNKSKQLKNTENTNDMSSLDLSDSIFKNKSENKISSEEEEDDDEFLYLKPHSENVKKEDEEEIKVKKDMEDKEQEIEKRHDEEMEIDEKKIKKKDKEDLPVTDDLLRKLGESKNKNYGYPKLDDPNFQERIYTKREFYYYKLPEQPDFENYKQISEYRKKICHPDKLLEHQAMLSNFINPDTPYRGLLLFHGTGTGKCKRGCEYDYINGQLIKAEDVWKNYSDKIVLERDGSEGEWSQPKTLLYVNSVHNNIITSCKVSRLYRQKICYPIREIILETGNTIGITLVHKMFKLNENKDDFVWTQELNEGDFIAIPKILYNYSNSNSKNISDNEIYLLVNLFDGLIEDDKIIAHADILKYIKYDYILYNRDINNIISLKCKELTDYINLIGDLKIPNKIMTSSTDTILKYIEALENKFNNPSKDYIEFKNLSYYQALKLQTLYKLLGINTFINNNLKNYFLRKEKLDLSKSINDLIPVKITKINTFLYNDYVYDLEIEDVHNYISNNICCHNTCAAIAIAEKFKHQVQRYGTQIFVLVPGPLLKANWKESLLLCTGNTYTKETDNLFYVNDEEKEKQKKLAIQNALQYYNIMSYKTFYRKVLGEKIREREVVESGKIKTSYRKTEEGEFERDVSLDRIYNLNNTLLIVEEAHNLTDNTIGESVLKIAKNSINLKIILLTATPMKNLASDIIDLMNFIRPPDSPMKRELIFTSDKSAQMQFKPGGLDYLKKMCRGYISHLRGDDPITFANKIEVGDKPKGLLFTKLKLCYMDKFQLESYDSIVRETDEAGDSLNKKSEAVTNFVFPVLDTSGDEKNKLIGVSGREGINILKNQIKTNYDKINKLVAELLKINKKGDEKSFGEELIGYNENTKNITGAILKKEYLKTFSTKFYQSLIDVENTLFYKEKDTNKKDSNEEEYNKIYNENESRTGFVYSNLVKIGIEIYKEILLFNGWLEFDENPGNYKIKDDTICYFCGKTFHEHKGIINKNHEFGPAIFMTVTGQTSEESEELIPEDKKKILTNIFSGLKNKEGKFIKLVLGSKVMNEGLSLKNIKAVFILDVYYNFGRIDQVIGRAIRFCSHYALMTEENMYPDVLLFKYAVGLRSGKLSTEEELYYKAELKHILIKKVERAMKEVAIDCPLLMAGNVFKKEVEEYSKCKKPTDELVKESIKGKDVDVCPAKCDYTHCDYKCDDLALNQQYYDPNRYIYKKVKNNELDYSTFTENLARSEINFAKEKIKELYITSYVYNLKTITDYVRDSYSPEKRELFDNFFVQKALDELIPVTENDFNNFKDILYDKIYRPGYLIYLDTYYIFQPFSENENVPMYYRTKLEQSIESKMSLYNYVKNEKKNLITKSGDDKLDSDVSIDDKYYYNFDDVMDYYDNRDEFEFVGIIDKELNRRKNKRPEEIEDVFKIREKREKILDKKRGTGIPSIKGAVCATSKNKEYLEDIAIKIGINSNKAKELKRDELCEKIRDKLIDLEKNSKGKKKITYIMIPKNHPKYKFPLNLEDRIDYVKEKANNILTKTLKFSESSGKDGVSITFKIDKKLSKDENKKIKDEGWTSKDDIKWTILIE